MTSLSCIQTLKEERRFCAWVYSLIPRPYHRPVFDCLQCAKTASNQKQEGLGTRLGLLILFPGSFLVPIRPVSPHTSFFSQTLSHLSNTHQDSMVPLKSLPLHPLHSSVVISMNVLFFFHFVVAFCMVDINWGEPERAPHLWRKRKIVYICIYMVRAYSIYAFCPICVSRMQYFHLLYMLKDQAERYS